MDKYDKVRVDNSWCTEGKRLTQILKIMEGFQRKYQTGMNKLKELNYCRRRGGGAKKKDCLGKIINRLQWRKEEGLVYE